MDQERRGGEEPDFKMPSDTEGEESEELKTKPYDALIVFGFGAKPRTQEQADKGENSEGWHLGPGTKARLLAAGELYKMGQVDKLILSEGAAPGSEKSGGELMKEYLMYKFPDIPQEKIIVEDKATNTIENFSYVVETLDKLGAMKKQDEADEDPGIGLSPKRRSNIALLSNRFHMARIHQIAQRFGVKGDGFNAEDVLELAAKNAEEQTGKPMVERFDRWHDRMSTPAGNEAWRDLNEIARQIYVSALDGLERKARLEGDTERESLFVILLAKTWSPELREELDGILVDLGENVDSLHNSIKERYKQLEIKPEDRAKEPNYRNYLMNENRWSYGMSDIPEYWLFQAAKVSTPRFRRILKDPKNSDAVTYLEGLGYHNPLEMNDEEFDQMRQTISTDEYIKKNRKTPPEFDELGMVAA